MDLAQNDEGCPPAYHAARFILGIWGEGSESKCTPFDVFAALTVWDEEHRAAFIVWAANPWWD
jgi:hypothetical protein